MDLYAKLKELDARVQAGELKLIEIVDEMRVMRADRLSRTQLAAATADNEPARKRGKRTAPATEPEIVASDAIPAPEVEE